MWIFATEFNARKFIPGGFSSNFRRNNSLLLIGDIMHFENVNPCTTNSSYNSTLKDPNKKFKRFFSSIGSTQDKEYDKL